MISPARFKADAFQRFTNFADDSWRAKAEIDEQARNMSSESKRETQVK